MPDVSDRLALRVLFNAATKPLNILALCGMVAAAVVFSAPWIVAAAVPVYGLLVAATVKDPKEAARLAGVRERRELGSRRSLEGVTGGLRGRVIAVLREEKLIGDELAAGGVAPDGLDQQVVALADEVLENARQASQIDLYLRTVDIPDLERRATEYAALARHSEAARPTAEALAEQVSVVRHLEDRRAALDLEIDNVEAGLGALRAQLVRARATAQTPAGLAEQVTDLRTRMRILAESLAEAYAAHPDPPTPPPREQEG